MPVMTVRPLKSLWVPLERTNRFWLQTAPEVVEESRVTMSETASTILALLITIPACSLLLVIGLHLGWIGRPLWDILLSGVVLGLVIMAWPDAQALPLWMRLLCWPASLGMVRMLGRLTPKKATTPKKAERITWEEIEAYFDFEEVIE